MTAQTIIDEVLKRLSECEQDCQRRSFDSVDAGMAANLAADAITAIESLLAVKNHVVGLTVRGWKSAGDLCREIERERDQLLENAVTLADDIAELRTANGQLFEHGKKMYDSLEIERDKTRFWKRPESAQCPTRALPTLCSDCPARWCAIAKATGATP